jgi:amidohydrolase
MEVKSGMAGPMPDPKPKECNALIDTIKLPATAVMPELRKLSEFIYNNPEMGYEEFKSSAAHVDLLRSKGFTVEYPYLGMATAFRAEYRSAKPGPVIAYLSEYDALPGVGHGCGHNILGAGGTGAGIVLRSVVDEIGGTALVFGTPAEETSGAKVEMADKGAFKGVDAAIVAHPAEDNYESGRSLALEALEFTFLGKASHAGSNPDQGINALNGVIGLFNAVNAMRGHIKQESRIHGIITDGGLAANIVPEKGVARFYIRAGSKAYLAELSAMMKDCAEGAARRWVPRSRYASTKPRTTTCLPMWPCRKPLPAICWLQEQNRYCRRSRPMVPWMPAM